MSQSSQIRRRELNLCPGCKDEQLNEGEFLCRFCFRRVPDTMRRSLMMHQHGGVSWTKLSRQAIRHVREHRNEPASTQRY